ncbi:MAG: endolytic transglycosylase MltG, partial [Alphaproteobacteria bacterium]|nr:endolytic transglycosylase MltG [Alphaproteobacteria bacterium]
CNPGRASIMAVANPTPRERAIYFVADGQGGHVFSNNVYEHQRNVERWKGIQRERQQQPTTPATPRP